MLSGALSARGIPVTAVDLNIEGLLYLAGTRFEPSDAYSKRILKNAGRNIASLRDGEVYANPGRYEKAVRELSSLLDRAVPERYSVGLSDFTDSERSPLRSSDLLEAASHPGDNPFHPFFEPRLARLLESTDYGLVGFSVNFLNQALCAFAMAGWVRRHAGRGVRIVMGGGLITSWMRNPGFSNPFSGLVDDLVAGPGEEFLVNASAGRDASSPTAPACSPGSTIPDFSQLEPDRYLSPVRILPYAASSGCLWSRCRFCPEHAEASPYLPHKPETVSVALSRLVPSFRPGLIHLLDNEVSPKLLSRFVLDPPGVPWYGFARASHPLTDPGFCRDLKQAGCVMLKLGVESGSGRVLDSMEKGTAVSDVSRVLRNLRAAGIGTYVYLLFGTPGETEHEAFETLRFTACHADCIGFLNLAVFNLPAGSPEAKTLNTKDFYSGDLSLYLEFSHPSGWNRDRVRRFLDGDFKTHPAIRPIIRRTPPFFTSNHAPLIHMFRGTGHF